ncbi:carbohydrate-binding protein [Roseateles sp. DB2]|uniref:carbohydrate-binding protein n=1 Tax=Roseateles sp. DB2 TaxID=3453717 RepID=UPI003EE94A71
MVHLELERQGARCLRAGRFLGASLAGWLLSLGAAAAVPGTGEVLAPDITGVDSGQPLQLAWAKWWGPAADRWQLLRNGAIVCQGRLDAASWTQWRQAQQGGCSTPLGAGENRLQLRLCQGSDCSDGPVRRVSLPAVVPQAAAADWLAGATYVKGARVQWEGRIYEARYWSRGAQPGQDREAWQLLANARTQGAQVGVSTWRGGAQAAYSVLFDDYCGWSNDDGQVLGEQELARRGLVAAFGVMPGSCGDPAWSPHWSRLKGFVSRGHEVFNHSWDHGHPMDADWAYRKWGGNELEIRQSTQKVAEMLDGYQMQFFSFPFDVATDEQLAFLKSMPQYLGTRTPNYWQANGVNAASFSDPFRLRFQVYANADQGADNPASLPNFLRDTLAQGGWGLRVFHSVNDGYFESVPLPAYQAHLDALQQAVQAGRLWVAGVSEILRYRVAREACALAAERVATGLLISFDNRGEACQRHATPLSLRVDGASGTLQAWQAGAALPLSVRGDGSQWVTANPLQGPVLLR